MRDMLLKQHVFTKLKVAIKPVFIVVNIMLSGLTLSAQKVLSIRPAIGLHSPLSGLIRSDYKDFVTLKNNNQGWLTLKYEIGIELRMNAKITLAATFSNGNAGYVMGVQHRKPCVPGGPPPPVWGSDNNKASGFNNKRLLLSVRYLPGNTNRFKHIRNSIELGLGFDFPSNENDSSQVILAGTNQCGEVFYLDNIPAGHRSGGYILPIQFNTEWMAHKKQPTVMLSVFYHMGLIRQFLQEIDYVTDNYRDLAYFSVRGTSWGFKLSVPITIWKQKIKGR